MTAMSQAQIFVSDYEDAGGDFDEARHGITRILGFHTEGGRPCCFVFFGDGSMALADRDRDMRHDRRAWVAGEYAKEAADGFFRALEGLAEQVRNKGESE